MFLARSVNRVFGTLEFISLLYSFFNRRFRVNLMLLKTLKVSSLGPGLGTYSMLRAFDMLVSGEVWEVLQPDLFSTIIRRFQNSTLRLVLISTGI